MTVSENPETAAPHVVAPRVAALPATAPAATAPNATILVADDEPALLRLMSFVLQKQGYAMLTASNGAEALQMVRDRRPDLVVLDIMMPYMDGIEVAEHIRAESDIAATPIVMLSAKAQDEDIARGLSVGVDTYITKPFSPEQLAQVVADLLRGRHAIASIHGDTIVTRPGE